MSLRQPTRREALVQFSTIALFTLILWNVPKIVKYTLSALGVLPMVRAGVRTTVTAIETALGPFLLPAEFAVVLLAMWIILQYTFEPPNEVFP